MGKKLKSYHKKYGHFDLPSKGKNDKILSQWLENIRQYPNRIPLEFHKQLASIGFDFKPVADWEAMFRRLKDFYQEQGHSYVPPFQKKYEDLFDWTVNQKRGRSLLTAKQVVKLNSLDFDWLIQTGSDIRWNIRYEELIQFKKEYGNTKVPQNFKSNTKLARWVASQRTGETRKKLSTEKIRKLKAIGFLWKKDVAKMREDAWEKRYQELIQFKNKHGHTDRIEVKKTHCQLGLWIETQINAKKSMSPGRKRKLEAIEQPQLHYWVMRQISSKEKLSAWKKKKLNAINFPWIMKGHYYREMWEEMYERLKAYKRKFGDCDVPQMYKDKTLASWVNSQRGKKISPEQKAKLNAIGFSWSGEIAEKKWEHRIQEYISLKKKNKLHTLRSHTQLYSWIYQQRKNFHKRPEDKKKS